MVAPKASDAQLLEAMERHGHRVLDVAGEFDMSARTVHDRIAAIERRKGFALRGKSELRVHTFRDTKPNPISIDSGTIFVASDCHYWPGDPPTAHRALLKLARKLGPQIIVINGDELDGSMISRHPRSGWEHRPTLAQEIKVLQERLGEIKRAAGSAHLLGTFGNHTSRFDNYLSAHAAAVEGVAGMKYEDLVPAWRYAWAWMVNGHTLIKHRIKGGIHATWNNTADAQISTVTGHLHNLRVTPRSTMSPINGGQIYGVDTGMLADPWGPQFAYCEQGPRNWRAGFAVLTFIDGHLMPPELVQVIDEEAVFFRGARLEV